MRTLTSTEAKQSFGDMLQIIKSEPVKITKRNKDFAVLISSEEYSDLKALEVYEDLILGNLAMQSLESGVHTVEDTKTFFSNLNKNMRITRTKDFDKSFFELEKSNPKIIPSLLKKIEFLQEGNLRNESLIGYRELYKIRIGKYRLIYTIRDGVLIILLAVRKREIAYKNLDKILKNISKN